MQKNIFEYTIKCNQHLYNYFNNTFSITILKLFKYNNIYKLSLTLFPSDYLWNVIVISIINKI